MMIVDTAADFISATRRLKSTPKRPKFPAQLMLVQPNELSISFQSAQDNIYMRTQSDINIPLALQQHANLASSLKEYLPVKVFPGQKNTPDAVFPNNVFASTNQQLIIGAMHYPHRQQEAEHQDILKWFKQINYKITRLSNQGIIAELTGALIIDHSHGIGYCGLSRRCNRAGAYAMHAAFNLELTYIFDLHAYEYHTNVIMSVLAGKALLIHPGSFKDPKAAAAIIDFYAPQVAVLSDAEKSAFCANTIAIDEHHIWLSSHANANLSTENRTTLLKAGFEFKNINLSEIEKAGGSLRCCIMEVF